MGFSGSSGRGRRFWMVAVPLAGAIALSVAAMAPGRSAWAAEVPLLTSVGGAKTTGDLDVMTFNLRSAIEEEVDKGKDYDKEGRRDAIAGAILNELPDLIGTQENVKWQGSDLWTDLDKAGHRYDWYGEMRECDTDKSTCGDQFESVSLYWNPNRLTKEDAGDFWFCNSFLTPYKYCVDWGPGPGVKNREWAAGGPRMATWIRFYDTETKKRFYAVNTHLDNAAPQARTHGIEVVRDTMAQINKENLPVILTGDFNSGKFEAPHDIAEKAGYRDAWDAAAKKGKEYETFRTDINQPPVPGSGAIDFIFTRANGGAATVSAAAISIYQHPNGHYPSDHTPVLARVRMP